jgi:hypothetical protein
MEVSIIQQHKCQSKKKGNYLSHYSTIVQHWILCWTACYTPAQSKTKKNYTFIKHDSHDNAVTEVTGCRLNSQGLIPTMVTPIFSPPLCPKGLWGSPNLLTNEELQLFSQRLMAADYSLIANADIKNTWNSTSHMWSRHSNSHAITAYV